MTEAEVQATLHALLEEDGWSVTEQWKLGSKRIDVVAERSGELNSYEVKVHDWRKASRQAALNAPFFTRSYVVLPSNPRRRVEGTWFQSLGVGLIVLSETGELVELIDAPRRELPLSLRQAHRMAEF